MTDINDVSKQIMKNLTEYTNSVKKQVEKIKRRTARDMVEELKETSPRSKEGGEYAAGWASKKVRDDLVVHNRTKYQITHLLEKEHAKRGGGRKMPQVHIAPVEEKHMKEYLEKVEKAIEKG